MRNTFYDLFLLSLHAKMTMLDSQRYLDNLYLINYELDIYVNNVENWLFSIAWFHHRSDLRIFTDEKLIRIKHYQP